jgi:hypothetical protein
MPSRRTVLALLASTVLSAPLVLAAGPAEGPEAFVAGIYARISAGDGTAGGADFVHPPEVRPRTFTAELCQLWAQAEAKAESQGEMGPVDIDLFTNSQDPQVQKVAVEVLDADADRARVRVALWPAPPQSGEAPSARIELDLRRAQGAWKIDDMRSLGADGWSLRGLLRDF